MKFDDMIGRPTNEFLDWFDRKYYAIIEADQYGKHWCDDSFNDCWTNLLMYWHRRSLVADDFENEYAVLGTACSSLLTMRTKLATQGAGATHRRGVVVAGRYACLFSELVEEGLDRLKFMAAPEPKTKPDQLGPSENWLSQALQDLSPCRRRAIELCVLQDHTVNQAADLVACTKNAMKKARHNGLLALKMRLQGKDVRTINGYVVEVA